MLNIYDYAPVRQWRHLDILQYKTYIRARLPRVKDSSGKVITTSAPWADKSVQYTIVFECYIINLLRATHNQTKTAQLARCGFNVVNQIIPKASNVGLARRELTNITHLSLDEKSFKKGHTYISVLSNPNTGVIVDVESGRTIESTIKLLNKSLNQKQQKQIQTISMDMWKPYLNVANKYLKNAQVIHDRFHLVKYLNEAIDQVRRQEVKTNTDLLKNTRYVLLKNEENLTEKQQLQFDAIRDTNLGVSKAWQVRENFKFMFNTTATAKEAFVLFGHWFDEAMSQNITQVSKVAHIICLVSIWLA